jgi:Family of unknown function (DUF6184)
VNQGRKEKAMTKTGKVTIALLASGLVGALGGAMSCGGVSGSDVVDARNQVTMASCNYYMMCKEIGPGLQYDTYQDCQTQVLGNWTNSWQTSTCQGHINQAALTVCLDAINSTTTCGSTLAADIAILAALSKCNSATVCSANVNDASAGN